MLTQPIQQLQRTAANMLPEPVLAAIAQSLGNCALPLTHRGPVSLEQPINTRNGGLIPRNGWDAFPYQVPGGGFVDVPGDFGGRGGDTSNYYGGNQFNFVSDNKFNLVTNQGGPTFNVGGNSYFSTQFSNQLFTSNFTTNFINGGYAPSFPDLIGPFGFPARDGRDGIDGTFGPRGSDGEPGLSGLPGPSGAPGSPGRSGSPGAPGVAGSAGENGIDGRDAASGAAGEAGPAGPAGAAGSDGKDGPRGDSGQGFFPPGAGGGAGSGRPPAGGGGGGITIFQPGGGGISISITYPPFPGIFFPGGGRPGPRGPAGPPGPPLRRANGKQVKVLTDVTFNENTCKLEKSEKELTVIAVEKAGQ